MTPVFQTDFGLGSGNCFAACVASLMDLPLDAVPNFSVADEDWWFKSYIGWVAERGFQGMGARLPEEADRLPPTGYYCILGIQSPNFPGALHAVIGERTEGGWKIVHDPLGERAKPIVGEPTDAQWIARIVDGEPPYAWTARVLENGEPAWRPSETREERRTA